MGKSLSPEFLEKFAADLRGPVQIDILGQMKPLPRLNVQVTTAELRAAGPPELLARLRLSITEEGVQWTTIESLGQKQDRLVPE